MFAKSSLAAIVAVLVCLSVCEALKCTGGVAKTLTDRCELYCGENEKCLCAKDENPSNITGCLQRCDQNPMGNQNITVNKCPDMECTDLERCNQVCSYGECSMECKSKEFCSQECPAKCTKMVCSSKNCIQSCKNCKMECTSGASDCQQSCQGGTCYSVCNAKTCHKSCTAAPGEKCEIKVVSSGDNLSGLSLVKIMFLVVFLVQIIQ